MRWVLLQIYLKNISLITFPTRFVCQLADGDFLTRMAWSTKSPGHDYFKRLWNFWNAQRCGALPLDYISFIRHNLVTHRGQLDPPGHEQEECSETAQVHCDDDAAHRHIRLVHINPPPPLKNKTKRNISRNTSELTKCNTSYRATLFVPISVI